MSWSFSFSIQKGNSNPESFSIILGNEFRILKLSIHVRELNEIVEILKLCGAKAFGAMHLLSS